MWYNKSSPVTITWAYFSHQVCCWLGFYYFTVNCHYVFLRPVETILIIIDVIYFPGHCLWILNLLLGILLNCSHVHFAKNPISQQSFHPSFTHEVEKNFSVYDSDTTKSFFWLFFLLLQLLSYNKQ